MAYGFLADLLVAIHTAYVAFVILGMAAILAGAIFRWSWVRNPWFRWGHLLAIVIVGLEAVLGITCPLTEWENVLRILAGQEASGTSFIGRCLHGTIFVNISEGVLAGCHIGFALLVLTTFCFVPPRRFGRESRVLS